VGNSSCTIFWEPFFCQCFHVTFVQIYDFFPNQTSRSRLFIAAGDILSSNCRSIMSHVTGDSVSLRRKPAVIQFKKQDSVRTSRPHRLTFPLKLNTLHFT
jgi:hypothetical protein